MNRLTRLLPALLLLLAAGATAQDIRYITDTLYVPVRSGQGTEFRIVHRGLPSGTRVTVGEVNDETGYAFITTDRGTEGWVLSRYLMEEEPAADRLEDLQTRYDAILGDEDSLRAQLVEAQEAEAASAAEVERLRSLVASAQTEVTEMKRISGNALTLDTNNRRLIEEAQVMQTRIEVLEADNQRLKDSEDSTAFINGALAVLLGVIIALVVPRLRPKRRPSSSWA